MVAARQFLSGLNVIGENHPDVVAALIRVMDADGAYLGMALRHGVSGVEAVYGG